MTFSVKNFFSKRDKMVTLIEEIFNGKLNFLCSVFSFTDQLEIVKTGFLLFDFLSSHFGVTSKNVALQNITKFRIKHLQHSPIFLSVISNFVTFLYF